MAITRNSKAKSTQPATKAEQDAPASDEQPTVTSGDDHGVTQDPQAQPEAGATNKKDTSPEQETKRIAVKSMTPSFRRAGFNFSRTETLLDVRRLTEEQLQAIQDEPRLAVRPVTQED